MQRLLDHPLAAPLLEQYGRASVAAALRARLDHIRASLRAGAPAAIPADDALVADAAAALARSAAPALRPVINATGIVLHTNLGRAPLAREAADAAWRVAQSYSTLEYELEAGRRGSRTAAIERLLSGLSGAEAALAVNNGAAALLLALSGLAAGGEVVVSRGELVEIGGGFRIPDIITQGGARLIECGSTNRTRLADYEGAITERTRLLLKVHTSNFRMVGFTESVPIQQLAALAHARNLLLVADLGSGALTLPLAGEPSLGDAVRAGADLVTASGDKLLGGPQAGLLTGTARAIEPLRHHPLLRALRLDKMSLAALEATLRLHRHAPDRIPALAMLAATETSLQARAERLLAMLPGSAEATIVPSPSYAGGGALPQQAIPSRAIALAIPGLSSDSLAAALREASPPVIARIAEDRVLLDLRTIAEPELADLAAAITAIAP